MRPSYRVLAATFMASPPAQRFSQRTGITPQQIAATLIRQMDEAPNPKAADAIFKRAMAEAGIYTDGVAAFSKGTEQMLSEMGNRDSTDRHAERMSADSRNTPVHWPAENLKFLRDVAAQASLQQGLSDRQRAADQHANQFQKSGITDNERVSDSRDNGRDLRSALMASAYGATSNDHARLPRDFESPLENSGDQSIDRMRAHVGLRDTIGAALEFNQGSRALADPLADESLLGMSDAV